MPPWSDKENRIGPGQLGIAKSALKQMGGMQQRTKVRIVHTIETGRVLPGVEVTPGRGASLEQRSVHTGSEYK